MRLRLSFWPINGRNFFKKIVIAGSLLIIAGCNNSKIVLLNQMSQDLANEIILQLGQSGIECSTQMQKDGTYALMINKSDQLNALAILQANGLPTQNYASMGDVFKKDSFISSPIEEQGRMTYALEQQISNMLSQIDGVINVKTQVSLPPPSDNLWQSAQISPAASVFIKYKNGYRLDLYTNRIKQLVANSVPGLTADKVEVLSVKDNRR